MTPQELKVKYIKFFLSKNHIEIPSASLVPENDPTTLFISAGMHPLVPYLLSQPHPLGKRLVDVQKCVRTGDIEEVGDTTHLTFFEMLGNWSLGDYFKKESIEWSFEFLTTVLNINPSLISVTCFEGDSDCPKDEESAKVWLSLGIPKARIHFLPKADNWWGPAGATGPCGPDTEIFIDTKPQDAPIDFKEGCKKGRYIEIWNNVFMQYGKTADGKYEQLSQKNVDTGMGIERTTAILNDLDDNFATVIFQPIIKKIEELSGQKYGDNPKPFRIIADHIRSAVFIIADGVEPSNKEAGYVLRRLIRRSVRQGKILGINKNFIKDIALAVLANQKNYAGIYPELNQNKDKVLTLLETEENRFRQTLDNGLKEINKLIAKKLPISGTQAFKIYESFGFPVEMIAEELTKNNLTLDLNEFNQAKEKHIEESRTLSAGKFKSGLADNSEIITKYHTATHLLHAALRQILGPHVQQSGSNITTQRLRFDFSHPEKLTEAQIKQTEDLVNQKIKESLEVTMTTKKFAEAQKSGALAFFGAKYPETVSVYTVGNFSSEVCTGPHAKNTKDLGIFRIIKEESAGSSKRRIYAILN